MFRKTLVVAVAGAAILSAAGCGNGDMDKMVAGPWTCVTPPMQQNGLTAVVIMKTNYHAGGKFDSDMTVKVTAGPSTGSIDIQVAGDWRINGKQLEQKYNDFRALSGVRDGEPLTQDYLDAQADAYRSEMTSRPEGGPIKSIDGSKMILGGDASTNGGDVVCTR